MLKLLTDADVVQRLVCGLAKAKMPVRFRSFAPLKNLFELFELNINIQSEIRLIFICIKISTVNFDACVKITRG